MAEISVGGVSLPSPVSISESNEILWSEDTGRTLSGQMVGDVIAEKRKLSVKWAFLWQGDVETIMNHLISGFFSVTYSSAGGSHTMTAYRGSISTEQAIPQNGKILYKSVSVDLIER